MKLLEIIITIIYCFTIKDAIASKYDKNSCDPLIDKKCGAIANGYTCDLINNPDCVMKVITETNERDTESNARPCEPYDKRRKCYKPLHYPHYPHAFYIGNPNVKHPNTQSIPQKHLDDLIEEQLNSKDPFTQYLQDLEKPNNINHHHGQKPHNNYHDNKKPHRPMSHHSGLNRPAHHHQQESTSAEWSHPLSHKYESNRPEYNKPDLHRPSSHRPKHSEEHSYEWERPMSHRPISHQSDSHRPESQRPESHRPESYKPEYHHPMYHRPLSKKPTIHSGYHSSEYNYAESHRPYALEMSSVAAYYQNNRRPISMHQESHNQHYYYKPASQYEYKLNSHEYQYSSEAYSEEQNSWKPYFPENYYSTHYYQHKPHYQQKEHLRPTIQRPYQPSRYGYYHQEPSYQASFDGTHLTEQFGSGYFDQRKKPYTNLPHKYNNKFSKHKSTLQHSSEEFAMDLFNKQNSKTIQVPVSLLESTELNIRELQLGSFAN